MLVASFPVANRPIDNPCAPANLAKMELIHPHPYDANLFIKCDLLGRMYITLCPDNEIFNKVSITCDLGKKKSSLCAPATRQCQA